MKLFKRFISISCILIIAITFSLVTNAMTDEDNKESVLDSSY